MLRVLHYVSRMDRAGQETFIMNLFRKIDRKNIQFDFLCSEEGIGDYDKEIISLGGHIYHIKRTSIRGKLKHVQRVVLLYRYLKNMDEPYDVFHIHTHHAFDAFCSALAANLAGIKTVVVHSHNTSALYHLKLHEIFKKLLPILKVQRFACSKNAGNWMFTKPEFVVVHNGIDLEQFHFNPQERKIIRQELGWEGKKVIGHVGRFNEQKNHKFLIEIFSWLYREIPDAHLVLVGKGELESEIHSLVRQYGLENAVSFLGIRSDVQKLYQGMDLFLLPSQFEGLGIVLVEAQACDLPCLISDTVPDEAKITDKVVSLSLNEDSEVWVMAAKKMLVDFKVRGDTSLMIREAGYDISDLATNLEKIYLGKKCLFLEEGT